MQIDVESNDRLICPSCGEEPYLGVSLPTADGTTTVVLCPRCDTGAPAQPLLTWFAVHQVVSEENLAQFAGLVRRWLEEVSPPTVSDQALAEVLAQWAAV